MQILIKKSDAIKHFSSISKLADSIGVTYQAVFQWGEYIPSSSVAKVMFVAPDIPHKVKTQPTKKP